MNRELAKAESMALDRKRKRRATALEHLAKDLSDKKQGG